MNNTATGVETLVRNTTGSSNTALGFFALINNTTGNNNIAVGEHAGSNLTIGSNNIDIGNFGKVGESNKIRIGTTGIQKATFIAGIRGVTVASGVGVIVGTDGKLGTVVSSARFKEAIKPMDKASETILALQPVTFRYKHELDPDGIPQFGLVAEEVEKVNPDLVARDERASLTPSATKRLTRCCSTSSSKSTAKVEQQQATIADQQASIAELKSTVAQQKKDFQATAAHQQEQIEALTAGLQKVSAQVDRRANLRRRVVKQSLKAAGPPNKTAVFHNRTRESQNQRSGEKERKNHESTDSLQKHNNSASSHRGNARLLCAFAASASCLPTRLRPHLRQHILR